MDNPYLSANLTSPTESSLRRLGAASERAACAELVRGAGCACDSLTDFRGKREGIASFERPFSRLVIHDPRCPHALAERIEARGRG